MKATTVNKRVNNLLGQTRAAFGVIALLLCSLIASAPAQSTDTDPRLIRHNASPLWTWAIGRLQVNGQKRDGKYYSHHIENCSATLIGHHSKQAANIIATAWHCLEHYRDRSAPIVFSIRSAQGKLLERNARILHSGGNMEADWALLELEGPIQSTQVTPLTVTSNPLQQALPISMAGFSRDNGAGDSGRQLSYHPNCHITEQTDQSTHSDCIAFKGASGGAVVQKDAGTTYFFGVISAGNGAGLSLFVAKNRFLQQLRQHGLLHYDTGSTPTSP